MRRNFLLISAFFIYSTAKAYAADTLVFDSTDRYLGACQLTDTSAWTLNKDIEVTTFQVWYQWAQGETMLPVTLMRNGETFAEFEASRGDCDPYQKQWCNADYVLNKTLIKGSYVTKIPNKRQCLKPGGTGAIRLYSASTDTVSTTPLSIATVVPTNTPVPTQPPTQVPVVVSNRPAACGCQTNT